VKRAGDVAGELTKTRIVSVGIPIEEELFLGSSLQSVPYSALNYAAGTSGTFGEFDKISRPVKGLRSLVDLRASSLGFSTNSFDTSEDILITLAGLLEPDGGMPGRNEELRIANSLIALLSFVAQGSTREAGPFRVHVERLLQYLNPDRIKRLASSQADWVSRALEQIVAGHSVKGDWLGVARKLAETNSIDLDVFWREVARHACQNSRICE
jgi:hypothetical protein